jgi:hypothetical protein
MRSCSFGQSAVHREVDPGFPIDFRKCFPNLVQAGSVLKSGNDEELRIFSSEFHVLQERLDLGGVHSGIPMLICLVRRESVMQYMFNCCSRRSRIQLYTRVNMQVLKSMVVPRLMLQTDQVKLSLSSLRSYPELQWDSSLRLLVLVLVRSMTQQLFPKPEFMLSFLLHRCVSASTINTTHLYIILLLRVQKNHTFNSSHNPVSSSTTTSHTSYLGSLKRDLPSNCAFRSCQEYHFAKDSHVVEPRNEGYGVALDENVWMARWSNELPLRDMSIWIGLHVSSLHGGVAKRQWRRR